MESRPGAPEPAAFAPSPPPPALVRAPRSGSPRRRTNVRRAVIALSAVAVAEVIGTLGFHAIEGFSWINSFYFESMLATGQGPPLALATDSGKVFAAVMGFVSVSSTLTAVVFVLGPLFARLWRETVEHVEREARHLEAEAEAGLRRLENDLHRRRGPP